MHRLHGYCAQPRRRRPTTGRAVIAAATLTVLAPAWAVPTVAAVDGPAAPTETGEGAQTGIAEIVAGDFHTCARLENGTARCWGDNSEGQVGDDTTEDRTRPVLVSNEAGTGPLTGITQISAGYVRSCARLQDSTARCWGYTTYGGITGETRPFVMLNEAGTGPLPGITQITAGFGSDPGCARMDDGTARCWRSNGFGGADSLRPQEVPNESGAGPLTHITQLTVGYDHTCARLDDGTARCWGGNDYGGLGDGTYTYRTRPVIVLNEAGTGPLTGITEVTAGSKYTCARLTDGSGRCWGYNASGRLGDGTTAYRRLPVVVSDEAGAGPLTAIADITAGDHHTCARLGDRTVRCWGANPSGELGDGTTASRTRPVAVASGDGPGTLTDVAEITIGRAHSCARLDDGTARCWGDNGYGGVGDGTTTIRPLPTVVVAGPGGPVASRYVALGDSYSSGEGAVDSNLAGRFEPGTDIDGVNECHRSLDAYPHAVRAARGIANGDFTFRACSGAQVADLVADLPGNGQWGEGRQLKAVGTVTRPDATVSLVTLSVGGNDFGFGDILESCISGHLHQPDITACRTSINAHVGAGRTLATSGGRILFTPSTGRWRLCRNIDAGCELPPPGKYVVDVPSLASLYTSIHRRAPNATIVVLGYPQLFPTGAASACTVGAFPADNGTMYDFRLTPTKMDAIEQARRTLNQVIEQQVGVAAGRRVPVRYQPVTGFGGHGPCDTGTRWTNGLLWDPGHTWVWNVSSYSFHPNAMGQQQISRVIPAN